MATFSPTISISPNGKKITITANPHFTSEDLAKDANHNKKSFAITGNLSVTNIYEDGSIDKLPTVPFYLVPTFTHVGVRLNPIEHDNTIHRTLRLVEVKANWIGEILMQVDCASISDDLTIHHS